MLLNTVWEWFDINKFNIIWTMLVILVVVALIIIIRFTSSRIKKGSSNRAKALTSLIQNVIKILIVVAAICIILAVWGVNTTTGVLVICTFLIVFGFGAKDLISDVFYGMSNIFSNLYEVNEIIEVDGFIGKVINITVTKTQVQSINGEVKTFANSLIKSVTNYSRTNAKANVYISIKDYKKIFEIQNILEEYLPSLKEDYPQIQEGPNVNGVEDIKDGQVLIRVSAKTTRKMKEIIERAMRKKILEVFIKKHIEIGSPFVNVKVDKNE